MVKYKRPAKMKHNQGRNPEYQFLNTPVHQPLVDALDTYKTRHYGEERVARGTVLAEIALDGSRELRGLYKEEMKRRQGDG